jgi:hypothetical protein
VHKLVEPLAVIDAVGKLHTVTVEAGDTDAIPLFVTVTVKVPLLET